MTHIVSHFDQVPKIKRPIALLIGSFDGVHLGHQFLIGKAREATKGGSVAAITFTTHPSSYFQPHNPTPLLCKCEHKLELLSKAGVDLIISLPFDEELASTDYVSFIQTIREKLPFDLLVRGKGSAFGKGRLGTEERATALGQELGFKTLYVEKEAGAASGLIRKAVLCGNFQEATKLLGRPYTLFTHFSLSPNGHFVASSADLTGICLPPPGHYPITCNGSIGTLSIDNTKHVEATFPSAPALSDPVLIQFSVL